MGEGNVALDQPQTEVVYVAKAESGLDMREEFVRPVKPSEQVDACYRTISFLVNPRDGVLKDNTGLNKWNDALAHLLIYKEQLDSEQQLASDITFATISFLDATLLDLIAEEADGPIGSKNKYYRDSSIINYLKSFGWRTYNTLPVEAGAIINTYPITQLEASELYSSLLPDERVSSFKDAKRKIEQLESNEVGTLFWDHTVSETELFDILKIVHDKIGNDRMFMVNIPVRMGDIVVVYQCKSTQALRDEIGDDPRFFPLSYAPIQDVWRDIVLHGVPIYPKTASRKAISLPIPGFEKARQVIIDSLQDMPGLVTDAPRLLRKHNSALHAETTKKEAENARAEYYAAEFGRQHSVFGKPEALITRSGVSANETAILASVGEILTTERGTAHIGIYFHHGWYYENLKSRALFHPKVDNVLSDSQANIICINQSPNIPYPGGAKAYENSKKDLIQRTIQRARESPDKQFAIIFDKTTNLNEGVFSSNDQMPSNVSVYESMSLSKHQRGDRNGFYGAVLHWGKAIKRQMETYRKRALGEPTNYTNVTFPYVNRGDIQRVIEHNHILSNEMSQIFQEEKWQQYGQWFVESYGYFSYILPPIDTVMEDMLKAWMIRDKYIDVDGEMKSYDNLTIDDRKKLLIDEAFRVSLCNHIHEYVESHLKVNSSLHHGDSFGLKQLRLGGLRSAVFNWNGIALHLKYLPRISYGLHTTKEQIREFANSLMMGFVSMEEESEMNFQEEMRHKK